MILIFHIQSNIQYKLINPTENADLQARKVMFQELFKRGLLPINIQNKDKEGGVSQKITFPGAIVRYKGREIAINLLKNNKSVSSEINLNNSIQNIEYEFLSAIYNLTLLL